MLMEWDWTLIAIILAFGFLAAFIDAVVGGGGLISIPALLAIGLPPATALGTNKLASAFGSFTSAIRYLRYGKVDLRIVAKLFPISFVASICGAILAVYLPAELLKPLVIVILTTVLIYTLLKKDWGSIRTYKKLSMKKLILFVVVLAMIGFYDGFLGGGTGSFLMFAFLMIGFDFLSAAGNAKVLNFASNLGALLLFIYLGHVDYVFGLSMAASMVVGSYFGAWFALKYGVGYVKVLFVAVTGILILKNLFDYLSTHVF
ncbi:MULTISPECIES: TSUP family transporter [unclassified Staphylococcus]|uniref:TSUP family transporter n=1 Tax=unclassified Staphylococcus TaxID=91994 RepID=UPI0021D169CE|nr:MULTISPECIES: TSUP family transporter [unclassified Staphylococcus]UXR68847.1 TSUP family transporter [Staphylococcus sp. IVB6246]UXR70904.1 TSUP family transporter [Staphylococcus sp. IVB6240]UXR73134.1 TSUP family transporter [Staphylococcus sp. IVB6238]UXR75430.1 TSUP family transporter [Staphylococcus sp. IVB6233]UXR79633.1 TSUP family transporter [Staphylococcus sp. IVB6218]